MYKVFPMMLLAATSTGAMAEWVSVGSNETGAFYADPGTVIKTSSKVKMRTLYDNRTAEKVAGYTFLSTEAQEEYDCRERRSRTLFFASYSRNAGKGRTVYADSDPHPWEPAKPGTVRDSLWAFACQRK